MEHEDLQASEPSCTALSAQPTLSRRAFLSITAAVGALTFLGSVCGGRIAAYADEAGNTHFVINVMSREDMCIVAVEASGEDLLPVSGMTVIITSEENGKQVSGTTDATGTIVLRVRELSPMADNSLQETYAFWGSVTAGGVEGLREVEIQRTYMESGLGELQEDGTHQPWVQIVTQAHNGLPYLSSCALNDFDVQYKPFTVALSQLNDAAQKLEAHFKLLPAGQKITATLKTAEGITLDTMTATGNASGEASALLAGTWFDGSYFSSLSTQLQLVFSIGNTAYTLPLKVQFFEPILPLGSTTPEDVELSSSDGLTSSDTPKQESTIPDIFACENDTLNLSFPGFPISIVSEPIKGRIGLSATMFSFTKAKKNGKWDPGEWKTIGENFGKSVFNKAFEDYEKQMSTAMDVYDAQNPDTGIGAGKATKKWEFTFTASVVGLGNTYRYTDPSTRKALGTKTNVDLCFKLCAQLLGTFSRQFWAGPVPIVATGDITISFTSFTSLNMQFTDKLADMHLQLAEGAGSSQIFMLYAEIGAGVAVGFAGVATVGLRGYGWFNFTTTIFDKESPLLPKGSANPHLQISVAAGLQVNIQVLFFKKTYTLIQTNPCDLYNNWNSSLQSNRGEFGFLESGFDDAERLLNAGEKDNGAEFEMMGDEALLAVSEFTLRLNSEGVCPSPTFIGKVLDHNPTALAGVQPLGAGESSYEPAQGIKPSYSEKLVEGVFSDGRPRVVTLDGVDYLFRIAVVTVETSDAESFQVVEDSTGERYVSATEAGFAAAPQVHASSTGALIECDAERIDGMPVAKIIAAVPSTDNSLLGTDDLQFSASDIYEDASVLANRINAGDPTGSSAATFRVANATSVPRGRLTVAHRTKTGNAAGQWSEPEVIDFVVPDTRTQYLRANTWDADFDVMAGDGKIHVAIDCMVRPVDEEKTLSNQERMQFLTFLTYTPSAAEGERVDNVYVTMHDASRMTTEKCWNPRLLTGTIGGTPRVILAYQRILSYYAVPGLPDYTSQLVGLYFNEADGSFVQEEHVYNSHYGWVDRLQLAMSSTGRVNERGNSDAFFALIDNEEKAYSYATYPPHADISYVVFGESTSPVTTTLYNVTSVTPVKDGFLYTHQIGDAHIKELKHITNNGNGFVASTMGDANVLDFCTNKEGDKLYALRIVEGTFDGADEVAAAAYESGASVTFSGAQPRSTDAHEQSLRNGGNPVPVQLYQIQEAQYSQKHGTFFEFYPLAQLDYAPDSFQLESQTNSDTYFLVGHITSSSKLTADTYRLGVPRVLGMELLSASSHESICGVGETMHVMVNARNVGNLPISGFYVKISSQKDGTGAETVLFDGRLDDLTSYSMDSLDNYRQVLDEDGKPTGEWEMVADSRDDAGIIWPGKERCFCIPVTIPEGWGSGSHDVQVAANSPQAWSNALEAVADLRVVSLEGTAQLTSFQPGSTLLTGTEAVAYNDLTSSGASYTEGDARAAMTAVAGLAVASPANGVLKASWNAAAKAVGVAGYQLRYRVKDSQGAWTVKQLAGTQVRLSGLAKGSIYAVQVRMVRTGRDGKPAYGPWCTAVSARVKRALRKVIGVKAAHKAAGKVKASWKTTRGVADSAAGYQVAYRRKGTKTWRKVKVVGAKKNSKVISGLKKGARYKVKVREYRKGNGKTIYGPWSATHTAKA